MTWIWNDASASRLTLILVVTTKQCPTLVVRDRLQVELVLLTAARRRADLTAAVPLSVSRLDRLEALCRAWGGPVSAAVYVAVFPNAGPLTTKAMRSMQELFDRCWPETAPPAMPLSLVRATLALRSVESCQMPLSQHQRVRHIQNAAGKLTQLQ